MWGGRLGIFSVIFLLLFWFFQTMLYVKAGCIGGRFGSPYVCDEVPSLVGYILISIILLGLSGYIIGKGIKARKQITRAEAVSVIISSVLVLIWINSLVHRRGSLFGNKSMIIIDETIQSAIYYGISVPLAVAIAWAVRFLYRSMKMER